MIRIFSVLLRNMPNKKGDVDFKKVRQKVGQKKIDPKATNVNIKSKRLRIQEQSILHEDQDIVNQRNKSLADLVGQFTHFNANTRREGVLGLIDLFAQNEILYSTSVSVLVTKSIPLLLDTDVSVRQALVHVYDAVFPNIPKQALMPFSNLICVFVSNGLTSINPAIRKSALLMMQTLLRVEPDLFKENRAKLLSGVVKLTTEMKMPTAPIRGVLSTNRSQAKSNASQQRPISDLALETIQLFFAKCFSQSSIYESIHCWSGCGADDVADALILSSAHRLCVPLQTSLFSVTSFLAQQTSTPLASAPSPDAALHATLQALLAFLFTSLSELAPREAETNTLRQLQAREDDALRSKSISEKELKKLLMLQELATHVLQLLPREAVAAPKEWIALLRELYPLRLTDAHRNELALKLQLQLANAFSVLLLVLLDRRSTPLALRHLQQHVVWASERKGEQGRWSVLPEVLHLHVEMLHLLCERAKEEKEELLRIADTQWRELLDKGLSTLSLPFMQFYHYVLEQQNLSSYDGCMHCTLTCLRSVPFSEVAGSKGNQLWRIGLRLLLSILKSLPVVDESFKTDFAALAAENQASLPTDLLATITAIASFCGDSSN